MHHHSTETAEILARAGGGDHGALGELFARYAGRLERMVRLRMDERLRGRVDPEDVLQEAFLDATEKFERYLRERRTSFFVWLRCIVGRRLADAFRYHIGAQARDVRREISIHDGGWPEATSAALAARLLGALTSPSEAAGRAERRQRLQEALDLMDPVDREIIALRHLEQLSNAEAAEVLGLQESAASKRHVRALKRLREILADPR